MIVNNIIRLLQSKVITPTSTIRCSRTATIYFYVKRSMKAQHSIWRIEINRKRSLLHQLWTTGPLSCRARRWRNNEGEGVLPLGGSRYLCVYVSVGVCGANLGLLLIPLADADHRPARSLYLLQHRRPDVQTCTVCTALLCQSRHSTAHPTVWWVLVSYIFL